MKLRKVVKKLSTIALSASIAFSSLALYPAKSEALTASGALGPVTPKDTIYQILTDRFFDGDTTNNIPTGTSSSLFNDANGDGKGDGTDLNKYQGGDWKGIQAKIPYLKNMGVTAVWITAPYENREDLISAAYSAYHGYHARNYFATNPHFGQMQDFIALKDALHTNGIKLVIDFVTNHTGSRPDGSGVLYEPDKDAGGNYTFDANGNPIDYNTDGKKENLIADINNDTNGFFHHLGDRGTDSSKFGFRHKELANLADFSQENGSVVDYLEKVGKFWKSKGIDGFRHDATLHMNPAFVKGFKDAIDSDTGGPVTHFGEFFIGKPDSKYEEYKTFPDRTGVNDLDFEYTNTNRNVFGNFSQSMTDFGNMMLYTSSDYTYENQAVTFLDNHDLSRFHNIQPNAKPYHAAIAAMMTARGTPTIYYGTEQYLDPGNGSNDAGRMFMQTAAPAFSETTTAFQVIKKLSDLRSTNDALAYGTTEIMYSTTDVLVFKRQFYDKQVIVAINRQPDVAATVPALNTTLSVGSYTDTLGGLLFGETANVTNVSGQNKIGSFTLSGGEVNVWSYNPSLGTTIPRIGDVVSTMGRPGNKVYIYGTGLGGSPTVKFGTTAAAVTSATDTMIEATVPSVAAGVQNITVTNGTNVSNTFAYTVLSGDQAQVIFHINKSTLAGQNVYVSGSIPELGNWNAALTSESFMNPSYPEWFLPVSVPVGSTFQFKFLVKDSAGNVTWEGGSNRTYTAPSSPTGTSDTPVYIWQP